MIVKKCSQCGVEKEVCKDNFHWDKRIKDGFVSACKVCKNKNKPAYAKMRREQLKALGIKEHLEQYQKHKDRITAYHKRPDVVEKRKARINKKYAENPEHYNAPHREYKAKRRQHFREIGKCKDKQRIDELDDSYIALLIHNRLGLSIKEARENKDLMEAYRSYIKLKRITGINNYNG